MSISGKHIWVCPLNWGLGHASRCIPLIQALMDAGAVVYLASDGEAADLLKKEFPDIPCFELPSYKIRYGQRSAVSGLFWRLPGIFQAIKREQRAFSKLLDNHHCDLIISDNRYGIYAARYPAVLITHQLSLPVAAGIQLFSRGILKHWFASFQELWVPDWAGEASLAGKLSRSSLKQPIRHLGILSRLKPTTTIDSSFDLLAILSGPEPQRTLLEENLMDQMRDWPGRCCLVRGTRIPRSQKAYENIEVYDLADTTELQALIPQAKLLICRTGYSSLMDLVQMKKSALLIPTPGQPEQEYLGKYHADKQWWMVQQQSAINLQSAWQAMEDLLTPESKEMNLTSWVTACTQLLSTKKETV